MSYIHFQCHACQQTLKVGAEKAGKKAKCHRCGTIVTIPLESSVSGPASPAPSASLPRPVPGSGKAKKPSAELDELDELEELDEVPARPARARFAPDEDEPPRRRGRHVDEEEDDRPRRRRDEEDDYDDTPRSRRREEDEEEDDRPRRRRDDDDDRDFEEERGGRRKGGEKAAWGRARLGLLLVFIGGCVTAGALLLFAIGNILYSIPIISLLSGSRPTSSATGDVWLILWRIAEPLALLAEVAALVGYVFCMLGPNKKGSMGLAIAVLAVTAIHLILDMIFTLPLIFGSSSSVSPNMGQFGTWFPLLLVQLFYSAELILFPLLLRAFALAKKDKDLAGQCIGLVSVAGLYTGLRLASFIFFYVTVRSISGVRSASDFPYALGWMTIIFCWLGLLALIGLLIWYLIAVWRGREVVGGR